ncbi:DUF6098 family protein, partial [Streptomyces sp. NPDC004050]
RSRGGRSAAGAGSGDVSRSRLAGAAGRTARPWLLAGTEAGRGPDNEPLVRDVRPLGWIDPTVLAEAETEIEHQPGWWGPLDRL